MISRRWTLHALVCVCLLFTAAGCDALGEEQTVILTGTELSFTYRFDGEDLSAAETNEVRSVNTVAVNLAAVLREDGFTLQDLRSITVESASVGIAFPVRQQFDFLERVEILLDADQLSPVLVAESSQIPEDRRRMMVPVRSTTDIEAYVREQITGLLRMETDQELSEGEYEMDVTLELAIEVGGL